MSRVATGPRIELHFRLEVEDDWPPVAQEGVPCLQVAGLYQVCTAPLFVPNLSVGDLIAVALAENAEVVSWRHVERSGHTTIWLLRKGPGANLEGVLVRLRGAGCATVELPDYGCYSVDVPGEVSISLVDEVISELDATTVAVAYPSFRHDDG